jgi:hypothetical protein
MQDQTTDVGTAGRASERLATKITNISKRVRVSERELSRKRQACCSTASTCGYKRKDPHGDKKLNAEDLRARWGIMRTYTDGDSWFRAKEALAADGTRLENRDVAHTGCCKGYSLATLLRPEFDGRHPRRRELDRHVRSWRNLLADKLTGAELQLLRSKGATNRSDWCRTLSLEDARAKVALSYDAALAAGCYSMSPVWLEEWEASIICQHESQLLSAIVIVEIHDRCSSNAQRSHFQVVLPVSNHIISPNDTVVVLRRMQCHYNPVWIDGKPRDIIRNMPPSFRKFFGLGC